MVKFEDLEIWDHIKGYEGLYKVSTKGNVFSIRRNKFIKANPCKKGYYCVGLYKDKTKETFKVHKLVTNTFYFAEDYEGYQVDHIDRNKKNNNLLNLRFCSNAENQNNIGIKGNNTSGFKGVTLKKQTRKWIAQITINGKRKQLGSFDTKEEAYGAYKEASKKYHGEYGYAP